MKRMRILTMAILGGLVLLMALPAAAQQPMLENTITVSGSGSAAGTPDVANLQIGVETRDADIATAFNQTNETIAQVIEALVEAGVAREDIRTVGLNIYQDRFETPMPMTDSNAPGEPQFNYTVSNSVRITIRDINNVADAINAAVNAGANNIYGLDFGISDQAELETAARADAIANAEERASELAGLIGAELGDVVSVRETYSGGGMFDVANMSVGGGRGAVIEPGQLSVSVQVEVTYRISR